MRISFALVCIAAIIPAYEHQVAAIRLPRAGSNASDSPQLQHLPQAETTSHIASNTVADAFAGAKSTAEQWV